MINRLRDSIETGFIDETYPSDIAYQPKLVINDKHKKKKVLSTLIYELNQCDEFFISVAFLSKSGVATLINTFESLNEKGIKGQVLVSQYLNFTQPEALRTLMQFDNIDLRIVTKGEFHAKGYFFRHGSYYSMIIGSSNLTAPALTTNKEWNLNVSGSNESKIIKESLDVFKTEFDSAQVVDTSYLRYYEDIYKHQKTHYIASETYADYGGPVLKPNNMQIDAMESLNLLRRGSDEKEPQDKALIISATGTGKTYLSVFDVQNVNPKRLLFIVHRGNIARAAMKSYQTVFNDTRSMGFFSGKKKDTQSDYIFSTIQTLSKEENLNMFDKDDFDYIIIDETHRAGAKSYQTILEYFNPKFLLGMTATPERTDGYDIFKSFDHNIAYEVRLNQALEEGMLCPFHYYGVTDLFINDEKQETEAEFNNLTSDDRVKHIIDKAKFYGTDTGKIRGLVFCNKISVCHELSTKFNQAGYSTIALTGESSEDQREAAIKRLEADLNKLDYIFTVDIFNEGVDIPKVNQIILLRPTDSAIIFIQQLGRGLRKADDKEYVTIIDFIGNYKNNYLIPVALYGDSSYSKDRLRRMITSGSTDMPGASTVNFDKISKEQIFKSIDSANIRMKKDLDLDYKLLSYKLGHRPMMMDFIEHGSRDPKLYVNYSKSYYNYVLKTDKETVDLLSEKQIKILEYYANHIADGKRYEELCLVDYLLQQPSCSVVDVYDFMNRDEHVMNFNDEIFTSVLRSINFHFYREPLNKKLISFGEKYGIETYDYTLFETTNILSLSSAFKEALKNETFKAFLLDNLEYAKHRYIQNHEDTTEIGGFMLYEKYSRRDIFRILCWDENPVAQNVGGYIVSPDKSNCPVFVNYHKEEDISETTKYEDEFINPYVFKYMSKSNRKLTSPDVQAMINHKDGLRMPLFIKKHNDEGAEFYYMGDVEPIDGSFEQLSMKSGPTTQVSVVKMLMKLDPPVEPNIYAYITSSR